MSALSVVTFLFSFLIFLISFLCLFFLMNLAKGLSILFIFSKNQLLVLLIFSIISIISFSFISPQIFMISFLLLILGLFCSSFSSCFRCKVRLSIHAAKTLYLVLGDEIKIISFRFFQSLLGLQMAISLTGWGSREKCIKNLTAQDPTASTRVASLHGLTYILALPYRTYYFLLFFRLWSIILTSQ